MPQSRLGPLAIESKLGDHPSQSSVWRAIHVQHRKSVAIKIFATPFGGTPEARAEFAREWEQLKSLQHPTLAKCFGGGFEGSDAYIAYELIQGETLAASLDRRSQMSWESVLDFAESLADGLEYLHKADIVFGPLLPDKILLSGFSPVMVDVRSNRVDTNYRTGRPPTADEIAMYAPELIQQPHAYSIQTDLYMLGALMYLAITGRRPATGETIEQITDNVISTVPDAPSSIVLECPVWMNKLVMQLLSKDPQSRPPGSPAVKLSLAEVRRRSMSRTGVAEHASSGFSPLNVTDQSDRDVARKLLGRDQVRFEDEQESEAAAWHDRPIVLIGALCLIASIFAYALWPLSEDQMRAKAESIMETETRTALMQAKNSYLEPMLKRFPDGKHRFWVSEQIERVEMLQAEHALEVKLKRNMPLKNEAERLYAEARKFEQFGDTAAALDKYQSMVTLMSQDDEYAPFVNLARRQIGEIENAGVEADEASLMISKQLSQANQLYEQGKVVSARKIWYSIVELYGGNEKVAPLVQRAQENLSAQKDSK